MPTARPHPPRWTPEELRAARDTAEEHFKEERVGEGGRQFRRFTDEATDELARIFSATDDLRALDGGTFRENPDAWGPLRYVCAPPVSEEDLWTLVGSSKFKRVPDRLADTVAGTIREFIDPGRFPWVVEDRPPTAAERHAAITSTAAILALERLRTHRRGTSSTSQEEFVGQLLDDTDYERDANSKQVTIIDDMARGTWARERRVAGSKCDVPVRLWCGRLLTLECKISNGPKNSWKRLNREVGGKAEQWRAHFGSGQVLTGAVLAGVYDLACLTSAQDAGVVIFWQHDLQPLRDFLEECATAAP